MSENWVYTYTSKDNNFSKEQMERLISIVSEWEREDFEFIREHPIIIGFHYRCPKGAKSFKHVYHDIEVVEKQVMAGLA